MGTFVVILSGTVVAALAVLEYRTSQQLMKLRSRHQKASGNLQAAIEQSRLVAENLVDAISEAFQSDEPLARISQAESGVKRAITGAAMLPALVGRQQELNDAIHTILPILSSRSHEDDRLVAACLRGWNDTRDLIEQATLDYNDAAMTWNEFLQSRTVRWLHSFRQPSPLSYVDWSTDSSDPGKLQMKDPATV